MADGMTKGLRAGGGGPRGGAAVSRPVVSALCLLSSVLCCAEELPDPTRPPASIAAPVVADSGAVESRLPVLQSIIISKTRRAAIIGGETVELGGKYGDAKLIEVNGGGIVLRGAQGRQVLTLFPDVKMTTAKRAESEFRGAAKVPDGNEIKNDQKLKTKPQSPESKARPGGRKAVMGEGK